MNPLLSDLHDGGAIAEVFSAQGFVDRCLRFERELAMVQAALGVIPAAAAHEIAQVARVENIDLALLRQKTRAVGLPLVGLVDQIVAQCRDDLGQYVHYGATTQDVMDCALALQMHEALGLAGKALEGIATRTDALAQAFKASAQAGRTNQQHALPVTFGFKAAVWSAALRRQIERLTAVRQRAATGQLGGAVGTLASFGEAGPETRRRVLLALGLEEPPIAWHCMRDGPTETVLALAQVAATLGKIGRDLLMMSSTEVCEVGFAAGRGASSTMPQKNNPVAASSVVALSRMLFHTAPLLLEASMVENERSLDAWYVELHAVPQCFCLAGALLGQATVMFDELRVDPGRMARNLALTGGAIVSETVQMALAPHLGLNRAHELVSHACRARAAGASMAQALMDKQSALPRAAIESLLDTANHLPFSAREVDAAQSRPLNNTRKEVVKTSSSLTFVLALLACAPGWSQEAWPARPITIIVPFAAGGTMDKLARELAEPLKTQLKQPVVINNLSGAGGNLGAAIAMRAAPDGYTIMMGHIGMATSPALYRNVGFKPETDFETLGVVVESPLVLVSRPQVPASSAGDLIRWISRQPHVKLANAGAGSGSHLCGLLLQQSLKITFTTVPYKGNAPAMTDLLGGHVDLMCDMTANALPQIQAGKLRAIAVTTPKPLTGTSLASVPTTTQFGLQDTELSIWFSLFAPKGTSPAIQKRISDAVAVAVNDPAFARAQAQAGIQIIKDERRTPEGHRAFLRREVARWTPVIKAAGVYAD